MRRQRLMAWLLGTTTWLTAPPAAAEVVTDGSLGPRVRLSGKAVEVGADLGQTRGSNLFHSFERFGVETGAG